MLIISIASANAQEVLASKDSIVVFYDSLSHIMKTEYLYKNEVDWVNTEKNLKQNLDQYKSFSNSLPEIKNLLQAINATHCQVFYDDKSFSIGAEEPAEENFSEQWLKKYSSYKDGKYEVKLLDGKYGYIFLPGWNFEDISAENIQRLAQPFYNEISLLKKKHNIEGWIIDLRLNFGGNSHPMLLGLYDLLGDGKIWGSLDLDGELINDVKLKNGAYLDNDKTISSIIPEGKRLVKSKVAIITSLVTASSGEIVAISFKGRKNTIFIGQETYGATTSNIKRDLPFGAFMALTTGIDCDKYGTPHKKIKPDISIAKGDNFDNLLQDKNIIEAIQYFKGKK